MNTTSNNPAFYGHDFESFLSGMAQLDSIKTLAQIMVNQGLDYSPTWEQAFPDFAEAGYHMYNMGDEGVCIVHDNGSACMNDARIVARII